MRPRKIIGAAAALAASASIGSCGIYGPPQTVYGPPEYFESDTSDTTNVETPSESFEPETNEGETVYGPPEWFETNSAENTSETTEKTEDSFRPETNEPEDVYGPPEWFETDVSETEDTFDPADNEPIDVYGPPEWFEDNDTTEETTIDPDTIPEEETDITIGNDTEKDPDIGNFFGGIFKPEENEPEDVYGPPEWFE